VLLEHQDEGGKRKEGAVRERTKSRAPSPCPQDRRTCVGRGGERKGKMLTIGGKSDVFFDSIE